MREVIVTSCPALADLKVYRVWGLSSAIRLIPHCTIIIPQIEAKVKGLVISHSLSSRMARRLARATALAAEALRQMYSIRSRLSREGRKYSQRVDRKAKVTELSVSLRPR